MAQQKTVNTNSESSFMKTEKTLQQQRDENEQAWWQLRATLESKNKASQLRNLEDIKKYSIKSAEEVLKDKIDLETKYFNLYKDKNKAQEKAQKELAKKNHELVLKYLKEEKKQYAKNSKEYKEMAEDEAKHKKALLDAMQKGELSATEYTKQTGQLTANTIKEAFDSDETKNAIANNLINGIKAAFESTIQTYGTYQTKINTRLQGSGQSWNGLFGLTGIESSIKNAVGVNPYVKLADVMNNVVTATEQGIAYNIEMRSFLQTVKTSIADTFDAFNANLTRIIRLQQEDSTMARLGLEANLTGYLNSQFLDTSYLNSAYDTVEGNLVEMISQMSTEAGAEVEYQIQKWLGALYSVGFSDSAVSSISQALGYLGSGNVSALSSNSTMMNLLSMSASKAGLSISELFTKGLDASTTNKLLSSMVDYLQEIAEGNNVTKSALASAFGMSVSDLTAAGNLSSSQLNSLQNQILNYSGLNNEVNYQMGQLWKRTSIAGMLNNLTDNLKYSMATSIASNPVTYALWEITSMIEDLTGGINLPTFTFAGTGVDLNTTVTNLMRAGIVGASTLGSIGSIISGAGSTFDPSSMLTKLGWSSNINGAMSAFVRGTGLGRNTSLSSQVSSSTYVGNTSSDAYYDSTISSANDTVNQTIEAKQTETAEKTTTDIYDLVSEFKDLVSSVIDPTASGGAGIRIANYGLTY